MRRALKLQPHHQTGNLLPHHQTSFRGLAILLLLLGFLLGDVTFSLQQAARADSLYLTATIPAPIPTEPAVIASPEEGWTQKTSSVTVSGTCPVMVPTVGVVIYRNNAMAGSVPCQPDGTFSLPISLDPGSNTLLARTLTITGDYGPDGTAVHGTYVVPTPPPQEPPKHTAKPPATSPEVPALQIASDASFITFGPKKAASWSGTITGGKAPYTIIVDWGDGTVDRLTARQSGQQSFDHRYIAMHAYTVRIEVLDAADGYANLSIAAITPYLSAGGTVIDNNPAETGLSNAMIWALYTAYLSLLALFALLWIVTHRQNRILFGAAKRRRKGKSHAR